MKLEFDPSETRDDKWLAVTDDGEYDASGVTPLDAACALVVVLEKHFLEKGTISSGNVDLPRDLYNLVIHDKSIAIQILERMREIIAGRQVVKVSDLEDIIGLSSTAFTERIGWPDLSQAQVKKVENGYLLDLPQVHLLSE